MRKNVDIQLPEVRNPAYGKLVAVISRKSEVRELWFENDGIVRVVLADAGGVSAERAKTIRTKGKRGTQPAE